MDANIEARMLFYIFICYAYIYEKSLFSGKYVFGVVLYDYIGDKKENGSKFCNCF